MLVNFSHKERSVQRLTSNSPSSFPCRPSEEPSLHLSGPCSSHQPPIFHPCRIRPASTPSSASPPLPHSRHPPTPHQPTFKAPPTTASPGPTALPLRSSGSTKTPCYPPPKMSCPISYTPLSMPPCQYLLLRCPRLQLSSAPPNPSTSQHSPPSLPHRQKTGTP